MGRGAGMPQGTDLRGPAAGGVWVGQAVRLSSPAQQME
jgi:hypothetical protein